MAALAQPHDRLDALLEGCNRVDSEAIQAKVGPGGDQFFDNDTVLTTRSDATVVSPVYFDSTVQNWVLLGNPGSSYGPVNFGYAKP